MNLLFASRCPRGQGGLCLHLLLVPRTSYVGWPGGVVFSPRLLALTQNVMRTRQQVMPLPPTLAGQPGGYFRLGVPLAPAPSGH